jgi:hypothetical protein
MFGQMYVPWMPGCSGGPVIKQDIRSPHVQQVTSDSRSSIALPFVTSGAINASESASNHVALPVFALFIWQWDLIDLQDPRDRPYQRLAVAVALGQDAPHNWITTQHALHESSHALIRKGLSHDFTAAHPMQTITPMCGRT